MRALLLSLLVFASGSPAFAQDTCESILAGADRSFAGKMMTMSTYFHGKYMGKRCGEVDYDRAYALAIEGGLDFSPYERILRERAESGAPSAKAALKRLGL